VWIRPACQKFFHENRTRNLALEQIAVCRNNGGDTGAYGIAFDEGPVAHADSRSVSNGIECARRKDSGRNTEIPRTIAVRLPKKQSESSKTDQ
jgi:hypothetical protein